MREVGKSLRVGQLLTETETETERVRESQRESESPSESQRVPARERVRACKIRYSTRELQDVPA